MKSFNTPSNGHYIFRLPKYIMPGFNNYFFTINETMRENFIKNGPVQPEQRVEEPRIEDQRNMTAICCHVS